MVLKILGFMLLALCLLSGGVLLWLNGLGSTDDFRITAYEAAAWVKLDEHALEIETTIALQNKTDQSQRRINLAFGLGSKAKIQSVALQLPSVKTNPHYSLRNLPLPLDGWPQLWVLTISWPQALKPAEELKLTIAYTLLLNPEEEAYQYFKGVTGGKWEVRVESRDLAFPIPMPTLRDFWRITQGDLQAIPTFPYNLAVTVPRDWEVRLGFRSQVAARVEEDEQKGKGWKTLYFRLTDPGLLSPFFVLPAFTAWRTLDISLTENRLLEFEYLWKLVDTISPFFELKGIDWRAVYEEYKPRFAASQTPQEHYQLIKDLLCQLRDGHSHLASYPGQPQHSTLGLKLRQIEGYSVITAVEENSVAASVGLRPGMEVLRIDGQLVSERIREIARMGCAATERAAFVRAYKRLTAGEAGRETTWEVADEQKQVRQFKMVFPQPSSRAGVQSQPKRYLEWKRLPQGLGYIKIPEWAYETEELAVQFDQALEELRDLPGLLLDLRGNSGGWANARVIGRLITRRTLFGFWAMRSGPGSYKLTQRKPLSFSPQGSWQYQQPLVLLIDAEVASASEPVVAGLQQSGRALVVGEPTMGSASEAFPIRLPSGAWVMVGRLVLYSPNGEVIEGRGVMPNVLVMPTLADLRAGRDTVLEKAIEVLKKTLQEQRR